MSLSLSLSLSFCLALCLSRFLARANHLPLRLGRTRDPALACNGKSRHVPVVLGPGRHYSRYGLARISFLPRPTALYGERRRPAMLAASKVSWCTSTISHSLLLLLQGSFFFLCERNLVFQKGVTQQCLLLLVPPRAMASPPLTKVSSELSCRFWIEADSVFLVKMGAMMGTCMTILSISRGDTID
jgi:hypothetical protein